MVFPGSKVLRQNLKFWPNIHNMILFISVLTKISSGSNFCKKCAILLKFACVVCIYLLNKFCRSKNKWCTILHKKIIPRLEESVQHCLLWRNLWVNNYHPVSTVSILNFFSYGLWKSTFNDKLSLSSTIGTWTNKNVLCKIVVYWLHYTKNKKNVDKIQVTLDCNKSAFFYTCCLNF